MLNHLEKFRYDYLVVIALVVATAGVYGQVIDHGFISYDDPGYVTENDVVQKGLSWERFLWAFTTLQLANWHPLTWLSHMLDVELFGMKPGLHHLVNVLFHVLNTALLFLVLRQMTGALWRSAFVAALFALHPLHVESVAWIAERKDVLSTLFWILTMWAYVQYTRKPGLPRCWPVLLFFSLGLLAKPMLVTLPLVLFLLDYWPLGRLKWQQEKPAAQAAPASAAERRSKKLRRQMRDQKKTPPSRAAIQWNLVLPLVYEKIPLFILSAASSLITFYAQQKGGAVASLSALPLIERVANAVSSYAAYLWKMLWPSGLVFFYPVESLSPAFVLASALLLSATTIVSLRWAERRPYLLVGWLWYLITLLPVIGIIKVGSAAMADRYTYVTLIGPFIILAWGSFDLSQNLRLPKAALAAASALIVSACMLVTYTQIGQWKDGFTLSRHALSVNSRNYGAYNCLAVEYMQQKKYAEALSYLKTALEINPRSPETIMNMGMVQYYAGKHAEALEHFNLVLGKIPNYYTAYEWLGKAYLATGKIDNAIYNFRRAIQPDRDNAASYGGMGEALIFQNRLDEAMRYTLLAIEEQPKNEKLYNNAGFILIRQGKFGEAVPLFQEAIRLAPDYARAHSNLGGALLEANRVDEAIHHFREAIRLEPGNESARENLKYALAQKKKLGR